MVQANPKSIMRLFALLLSFAFLQSFPAFAANDLEALAGKWSVKKTNDQGQDYTQTIAVKKDKFIFEILGAESRVYLHAEGAVKLETLAPFSVVRFVDIRAGVSPDDLRGIEDEFASIYRLDGDTWIMAANFDKVRDRQPPSLDAYKRVQITEDTSTLLIDEVVMADTPQSATWFFCFEATADGVTRTHRIQGKGYDKNQVTIPLALEIPKVKAGQKCSFKMQLDDVDDDVCTEEVDNRSTGEFIVSDKGSQEYKPENNWRYTIRWRLK